MFILEYIFLYSECQKQIENETDFILLSFTQLTQSTFDYLLVLCKKLTFKELRKQISIDLKNLRCPMGHEQISQIRKSKQII